jgi:hypothetical protein
VRLRIAIFLLALPAAAHAGYFVEGGAGLYSRPQNGTWWQDGFANSYDNRSTYVRAGAVYRERRLSLGVSAFSLGDYEMTAQATPDDANYNAGTVTHCNGECLPLSTFRTAGGVRGIAITSGVSLTSGLVIEAGPTYYRQRFALHVENHAPGFPATYDYSATSSWRLGGMLAIRARVVDDWFVSVASYRIGANYNGSQFPAAVDRWTGVAIGWEWR